MSKDYLWRGGKKIKLEKEPTYFTVVLKEEEQKEQVTSLPGFRQMKRVHHSTYKVQIEAESLNSAMDKIRSDQVKGVCHHAYNPASDANTRYYLTEEMIVKFASGTPIRRIEQIIRDHCLLYLRQLGEEHLYLLQVTSDTAKNPIKCSNELAELPEVTYAEPNLINRFQGQEAADPPSDTLFSEQWHLDNRGGIQLRTGADVDILEAWAITKGSRDIAIAIIDDGVDISHPDFQGEGKIVAPKDYVDGDSSPFPESFAQDYHGTPCAGVAVAEENGQGVVGAAPACALQPIRFPLTASDRELWEIFDFAATFSDVISCSWGPPPVYSPLPLSLTEKFEAITTSGGPRGKGSLILFAAGNYNAPLMDMGNTSFRYRGNRGIVETTEPILNGFAIHPDVMAVGSSNSLNERSIYSNWGKELSVCAPSNNFHPLNSQLWVEGRGITTTDNETRGLGFRRNSLYTARFGGTSSATPLAAGVAALVIASNPELTAREVKRILEETTDKITDENPDPILGHNKGIYDAEGHSEWFGFGKVNAGRAVRRAVALREQEADPTEEEDPPLPLTQLIKGNIDVSEGFRLYDFEVQDYLRLTLTGPDDADFDLYVKREGTPTMSVFDVRASDLSSSETIILTDAPAGTYTVMVKSYTGVGDFELEVSFQP
ncbi:MAG: S8 family serine peptidase [Bacteroidota bacterium]